VLPCLQSLSSVVQRDELADSQGLVAQPAVVRLDQPVVSRLAKTRALELDATAIRPVARA
jgi:hypothetical protein